ncbi:MliC family protein [Ramlibacter sp. XY19]|uniref:MliC family protein n=1 Tax=Ramlibacter paludis TaxID=2908000 RepID=UPI0023D9A3C0|nr:MliC family protein [Ramlibacter paludis]MCG2594058.1 MliC family protein [Ramlibacter paludis]
MRFISLLLPALLLAGCETTLKPGEAKVVYRCEDGLVLRVHYSERTAKVTLPSKEELVLPLQPTGSGTAYATAQHQLRGKGDEATWTTGRSAPVKCRVLD